MEWYYRSKPEINGYRQRMHSVQRYKRVCNITEQRFMDQQSQVIKKQWLTKSELEEIQRGIEDEPHGHIYQMITKVKLSIGFQVSVKKVEMYFSKMLEWLQKTLVTDMRMLSLASGSKKNCQKMRMKCRKTCQRFESQIEQDYHASEKLKKENCLQKYEK